MSIIMQGQTQSGFYTPPAPQGWLCPKCHSAHAPSVLTCPAYTMTTQWAGDTPLDQR